jgi:hypothetical protein
MNVPHHAVPLIHLKERRNFTRPIFGTHCLRLLMRARTCVLGTNKSVSQRPYFYFPNKIETIMWDTKLRDIVGTLRLVMGVAHG